MLFEHWIYSTALALFIGAGYYRLTGRDLSGIIIASAYAPDADMFINSMLRYLPLIGENVSLIRHGDFHNIAALALYALSVALVLYPLGIRFADSLFFSSAGFAAHMFEDAIVFSPAYAFLYPLSGEKFGIGLFSYNCDWYGIADKEVLIIGLILMASSLVLMPTLRGRPLNRDNIQVDAHVADGEET